MTQLDLSAHCPLYWYKIRQCCFSFLLLKAYQCPPRPHALPITGMGEVEEASTYDAAAPALLKMERAAIAAASHITYHPPELLGLIRDHLCAAGLSETAAALDRETADSGGSALKGLQTLDSAFPGFPCVHSLLMPWQLLHVRQLS